MDAKIHSDDLLAFTNELLCKSGVDKKEASIIAEILVWNDLIGRYTQGIWRIPVYLKRFKHGLIKSPCKSRLAKKTEIAYILHGKSGFGQYLSSKAMSKAIRIAKQYGVGLVGVRRSNHFGSGAYYAQLAAKNYQIGFAFSNSIPHVAPYGGFSKVLGTNPFAFAAPTYDGKSILVDFSTGSSAGSSIMRALEANQKIPEGILVNEEGNNIIDPKEASKGTLLPFGGAKGYCIGLLVEILSGVITGSGISHEIASLYKCFDRESNVGHLFMTIDISRFMPLENYFRRISQLIIFIKQSKKMKEFDEILIPGESRWRYFEKQKKEGIQLDIKTIDTLTKLAKVLGVSVPW